MKKEQARAYCEILDNLKRDLVDSNNSVVGEILDKIEGYASGVYTSDGDELIVIPSSALDEIFGNKMTYCVACEHICPILKMAHYTNTKDKCPDYKEVRQ